MVGQIDIWIDRVYVEKINGWIDRYMDIQSVCRKDKWLDRCLARGLDINRFQEGEIVGQMDRRQIYQIYGQRNGWIDAQIDGYMDKQIVGWIVRQIG